MEFENPPIEKLTSVYSILVAFQLYICPAHRLKNGKCNKYHFDISCQPIGHVFSMVWKKTNIVSWVRSMSAAGHIFEKK